MRRRYRLKTGAIDTTDSKKTRLATYKAQRKAIQKARLPQRQIYPELEDERPTNTADETEYGPDVRHDTSAEMMTTKAQDLGHLGTPQISREHCQTTQDALLQDADCLASKCGSDSDKEKTYTARSQCYC